jgi:Ecdysteroid kinase-like family
MSPVTNREVALIRDPKEITTEWLTKVLRAEGSLSDAVTVTHLTTTLTGEGVGVLSRIYRVRPEYSGASTNAPDSVIVKLATDNEASRFTADVLSAFKREMVFYAEFRHTAPFATPRCFAAVQATDNSDFTLVMEDLGTKRFQDQLAGSTWDDTVAAIQAIASFHAGWMGKEFPYPELYVPLLNEGYLALLPMLFTQNWPTAQTLFADLITDEIKAFGDEWGERCEFMLNGLYAPYTTICHGDWRADNVLFDPHTGGVIGIDFQLLGPGCGTFDVAYYVSQSIDPDERNGRDRELVQVYIDALRLAGVEANFDEVWMQYRLGLLFALCYPVNNALAFEGLPERGKRLIRSMFERATSAILDTNATAVLVR